MATPSRQQITRASLEQRVAECVAASLRDDLFAARVQLDKLGGNLPLWKVLNEYPDPFGICAFSGKDAEAGFRPAGRRIEFNLRPIRSMYLSLVARHSDRRLRRALAQRLIDQFLLHELDHAAKGFLRVSDVRAMARLTSRHLVGLLDLAADVVAAQRGAILELHREGARSEDYCWQVLQELVIMIDYWLPVVKAPRSKRQKVCRFAGLLFVAARLANYLVFGSQPSDDDLPLDTPLYALADMRWGKLEILALAPSITNWLPRVKVDLELLVGLVDGLGNRPAAELIDDARRLLIQTGMLEAPLESAPLILRRHRQKNPPEM